jgi:hypothetical protein
VRRLQPPNSTASKTFFATPSRSATPWPTTGDRAARRRHHDARVALLVEVHRLADRAVTQHEHRHRPLGRPHHEVGNDAAIEQAARREGHGCRRKA